jgi:hypothetical protein
LSTRRRSSSAGINWTSGPPPLDLEEVSVDRGAGDSEHLADVGGTDAFAFQFLGPGSSSVINFAGSSAVAVCRTAGFSTFLTCLGTSPDRLSNRSIVRLRCVKEVGQCRTLRGLRVHDNIPTASPWNSRITAIAVRAN